MVKYLPQTVNDITLKLTSIQLQSQKKQKAIFLNFGLERHLAISVHNNAARDI